MPFLSHGGQGVHSIPSGRAWLRAIVSLEHLSLLRLHSAQACPRAVIRPILPVEQAVELVERFIDVEEIGNQRTEAGNERVDAYENVVD